MKEAHVGLASNFLPGLRKMCVMSIAKQNKSKRAIYHTPVKNQDQQKLPFKNNVRGI